MLEFEDNRHPVSLDRLNRPAQSEEIAALNIHLHKTDRRVDVEPVDRESFDRTACGCIRVNAIGAVGSEALEVLDRVKELLVGAVINGTEVSRYILAIVRCQSFLKEFVNKRIRLEGMYLSSGTDESRKEE